jgi:hypothetical protein
LVQNILPRAKARSTLAEPIGYLTILSRVVIIPTVATRVASVLVLGGWVLIVVRSGLMALGG